MKKLLIIGDSTATALVSQYVPIAKLLSQEYLVDLYTVAPVNLQLAYHMPFINHVVCGKVSTTRNELDYITPQEGLKYSVYQYFYDLGGDVSIWPNRVSVDVDISELNINKRFIELVDQYDRILILYDGEFYPTLWLLKEIFKHFENKCIGRFLKWSKEMRPLNLKEYIPKETVEALGFEWKDDLLKVEFEWYKEFDSGREYPFNSIYLKSSAGCESYMPYHDWQTFFPCGKLSNLLKKQGFSLTVGNRREDARKQLFHLKSTCTLLIDSSALWLAKGLSTKYIFCYNPPNEIDPIRLGINTIIDSSYTNLHQLTPEIIVDTFLATLKKEGCPLRGGLLI